MITKDLEYVKKNTGQELWKRAKTIIPGGNMLLSKRSELFLPENWPSYFSKAKGCFIWDLDGNQYIDMSLMSVGTNILGYGHEEIDSSVQAAISLGNMSSLNCAEEVYLAEKLVELHPWSEMVRFARTGGEANAIAIRIARASTGKDKVAICGYHGWHDWYLATNLKGDDSLKDHLLPGLSPNGVPKELKGSVIPFRYNQINELEEIIKNNDIAAVKMEVERSYPPENGFLEKVKTLCVRNNILLIFDECTSGFRETFGGLHLKYKIFPDIAIFGKALGNGYAITAVIGTKNVMQAAQNTFISSTFWTERIGPSAGLKTLEVMNRLKSWDKISMIGKKVSEGWRKLAIKYDLKINISGISAMPSFQILSKDMNLYKTFISQEMLKKGFLASNTFYASISHKKEHTDHYFFELDQVFKKIKEAEEGLDITDKLDGPIAHIGFKRLS